MLYLDTSVLLVATLTQSVERVRYAATRAFLARLESGALVGATSFHALHEVHLFALANAPDTATGAAYGKAALAHILAWPIQILPLVSRVERGLHARTFRALRDPADVPHAIAAWASQCEAIVTYDSHSRPSHISFRTERQTICSPKSCCPRFAASEKSSWRLAAPAEFQIGQC